MTLLKRKRPQLAPATTVYKRSGQHQRFALGSDAHHTLTVKGAPSALPILAGHCKVAAANNGSIGRGLASAFDFLAVARIELDLAEAAVSLDEFHADDAAASVAKEAAHDGGFGCVTEEEGGHGKKGMRGSRLVEAIMPMDGAPVKPLSHQRCLSFGCKALDEEL